MGFYASEHRRTNYTVDLYAAALAEAIDALLNWHAASATDRGEPGPACAAGRRGVRGLRPGQTAASESQARERSKSFKPHELIPRKAKAMSTNTESPSSQIPKLRPAIPPTGLNQGHPDSCLNFNLPDGRGVYLQVPYGASPDDIAYVMDVISGQLNALARRAAPTG